MKENVQITIDLLTSLGLLVNLSKSILKPVQLIEFLGMIYLFQNNGDFSSNFKTRQNHKAMQQTFQNANYFHSGHLNTARSARSSKTSNSHSPTSLQRNSILTNRGIQDVPKLQPALHPQSKSYPVNSLVEVKCSQGQWKPNFRLRPRHNHCH